MAKSAHLTTLEQHLTDGLTAFCREQKAREQDFAVYVGRNEIGRVYAALTWNKFDAMEITQRQKLVWNFLRNYLSADELDQISLIYTRGAMEVVVEDELEN